MSFVPPPRPEDVDLTGSHYPHHEIIAARRTLLDTVQNDKSEAWRRIKRKLGILPDGRRVRSHDPEHVWIPSPLPEVWSARVCLHNPQAAPAQSQVKTKSEPSQKRVKEEEDLENEQYGKKLKGEANREANEPAALQARVKVEQTKVKVESNSSGVKFQWGSPALGAAFHKSASASAGSTVSFVKTESAHSNYGREGKASNSGGHISTGAKIKTDPDTVSSSSSDRCLRSTEQAHSSKDSDFDDVVVVSSKFPAREPASAEVILITSSPVKQERSGEPLHSQSLQNSSSNPSTTQGKEPSETWQITQESSSVEGETPYKVMFCCDLCPYVCDDSEKMVEHLQKPPGHYSASRCLGLINPSTGELVPKLLSAVSEVRYASHAFMDKVPACPLCYMLFVDVGQCADHCTKVHQIHGLYSLRTITSSRKLRMRQTAGNCVTCGQVFQDNSLQQHIAQTGHMTEYLTSREGQMSTVIFPCSYCPQGVFHTDYFTHKHHFFTQHSSELAGKKFFTSYCLTLSKHHQTMRLLPREPGVGGAGREIYIDDYAPVLPSVAGATTSAAVVADGGSRGSRRRKNYLARVRRWRRKGKNADGVSDLEKNKPMGRKKQKSVASKWWSEETVERKRQAKLERRKRRRAVVKNNKKISAAERKIACTVTSGAASVR